MSWTKNAQHTLGLLAACAAWGPNPAHRPDFDGNGSVSAPNLLTLLAN